MAREQSTGGFSKQVRRRRLLRRGGALVFVGATLFGCSDGSVSSDCGWLYETGVSMVTWWKVLGDDSDVTSTGEDDAARQLRAGYLQCSGGKTEIVTANSKEASLAEIDGRTSPAGLALINIGSDFRRFVHCPTPHTNDDLRPLQDLSGWAWKDRIPELLRPLVSCPQSDGPMYAMPIGLHQLNQLYWKLPASAADVFDRHRAPFSSIDTFIALLQDLDEQGYTRPLVLPDDSDWPWSLAVVENVMVARVKADVYEAFWNFHAEGLIDDAANPAEAIGPFEDAVKAAERLSPYIQKAASRDNAFARIADSDDTNGLFTIMGDWVVPDLAPGIVHGPFPGSGEYYVYSGDAFAVPVQKATQTQSDTNAVNGMLKAVSSYEVQKAYAEAKHSRMTVEQVNGVTRAKTTESLFPTGKRGVPGLVALLPYNTFNDFQARIGNFMRSAVDRSSYVAETKEALLNYAETEYCAELKKRSPFECNCPTEATRCTIIPATSSVNLTR